MLLRFGLIVAIIRASSFSFEDDEITGDDKSTENDFVFEIESLDWPETEKSFGKVDDIIVFGEVCLPDRCLILNVTPLCFKTGEMTGDDEFKVNVAVFDMVSLDWYELSLSERSFVDIFDTDVVIGELRMLERFLNPTSWSSEADEMANDGEFINLLLTAVAAYGVRFISFDEWATDWFSVWITLCWILNSYLSKNLHLEFKNVFVRSGFVVLLVQLRHS